MKKILILFQAFKKGGFVSKIPHVFRMYKSYKNGGFKMDFKNVLVPIAAILYFISPINLSFEWIPLLGQIDDLAILAFVIPMLSAEVDRFLAWEKEAESLKKDSKIIDAEIVE